MKKSILTISILYFLFSCVKEDNVINDVNQNQGVSERLMVLEESGIDLSSVEVKDKYFLIEGDIKISFESLPAIKSFIENKNDFSEYKAYKYSNPYYITEEAASDIKIYAEPSISVYGWLNAVKGAISAWNNLNSKINMSLVSNSTDADIIISTFIDFGDIVAYASACIDGKVGNDLGVNILFSNYSASIKLNTIVHELGHAIGLAHSDGTSNFGAPILIPGTSSSDNSQAVMYKYTHDWYGFSYDEILAVTNLFPSFTLNGPTNLTNTRSGKAYTYSVDMGNIPQSECIWYIKYTSNGNKTTLSGTGSSIVLYTKYISSIKDRKNELNYLEVYCPALDKTAQLIITLKDGYRLYN